MLQASPLMGIVEHVYSLGQSLPRNLCPTTYFPLEPSTLPKMTFICTNQEVMKNVNFAKGAPFSKLVRHCIDQMGECIVGKGELFK